MKRLRTIRYISETPIEVMVKAVRQSERDVETVIEAALESRKEYGLKVQKFIEELRSK